MKFSDKGLAGIVLAVGLICQAAMADGTGTLNLDQVAPFNYDVGGEFTAYVLSGSQYVQNYAPVATVGTGFDTFCVEVNVDFDPGNAYIYNFALNPTQSADGTSLSEGAAYLYSKFATGQLTGYNYSNPSTANAGFGGFSYNAELQAAIWWFQGNQAYGDGAYPSGTNNYYYQLALSSLGLNATTAETPDNGQFGVEVLQLTYPTGAPAQNQLVYVGVPDNGGTLPMLAMALAGLAAFAIVAERPGGRKQAFVRCAPSKRIP